MSKKRTRTSGSAPQTRLVRPATAGIYYISSLKVVHVSTCSLCCIEDCCQLRGALKIDDFQVSLCSFGTD
jgi:hypothetical protein